LHSLFVLLKTVGIYAMNT